MDKNGLIFVDVLTFSNKAHIHLYKSGMELSSYVNLNEMADTITQMAVSYGVNNIKLSGSPKYLEKYVKDIKEIEKQKYAYTNLEIEVIKV